jgi:hypothetical protein
VSDPILHLTILQSPVFLLNSCLGLFTAADLRQRLFSRSYETILPSSLAVNHSSALGYSPRLPVSVCGTGSDNLMLRRFSRKPVWVDYSRIPKDLKYYRRSAQLADLHASLIAYNLQRTIPSVRTTYTPSSLRRSYHKYGNINPFAIGFTSRFILRTRLTRI